MIFRDVKISKNVFCFMHVYRSSLRKNGATLHDTFLLVDIEFVFGFCSLIRGARF